MKLSVRPFVIHVSIPAFWAIVAASIFDCIPPVPWLDFESPISCCNSLKSETTLIVFGDEVEKDAFV